MFLLLWRALNLHRRVCAFNHKIQQLKGFMYLFMYVRNSETLLVLHFRMWFTGFLGDTWESVLPPTHPVCHSVCPCTDFTTAASSSWHTYCREEGGRFTTCSVSYFHRFIWSLQKLEFYTCRTHSRDSEPEVQILKYLEMEADFKALLIIEHSCTHLLTLLLPYMDVPDSRAARLCCQVRHCAATPDRV